MKPRDFLYEEWENIHHCLDQTLRFEYGNLSADDFYNECIFRLNDIKKILDSCADENEEKLERLSKRLSDLSSLISRMERAHVDEVSWPFAEQIIRLATPLCAETDKLEHPDKDSNGSPLFPILAEGGLSAYQIFTEETAEAASHVNTRHPIHTIIFPRSLKYHVLLHAILGHEICHAILSNANWGTELEAATKSLLYTGILENDKQLNTHLSSENAPESIKNFINKQKVNRGRDPCLVSYPMLRDWRTEFLCDMIGLLLIGPSFLPAHYTILRALSPFDSWGKKHPPFSSRLFLLQQVCEHMEWSKPRKKDSSRFHLAEKEFWARYSEKKSDWFNFFKKEDVNSTVDKIKKFLNERAYNSNDSTVPIRPISLLYPPIPQRTFKNICELIEKKIPPTPRAHISDGSLCPPKEPYDFRHILYGGWIVFNAKKSLKLDKKLTFLNINKFCHLAILQNRAIEVFNDSVE